MHIQFRRFAFYITIADAVAATAAAVIVKEK